MWRYSTVCALLLAGLGAVGMDARDVWVIRGLTRVEPSPCLEVLTWSADAVLHNLSASEAVVRIVGTSHGPPSTDTVALPASRSRAMSRLLNRPDVGLGGGIWVTHLDVPDDVRVEGRLEFIADICGHTRPPNDVAAGAISLPVFRELRPSNEPQVHLGTDLGVQPARYNVGIYNAGDISATALVEISRPACLADAKMTRSFTIPPRTLLQESFFGVGTGCMTALTDVEVGPWVTYTTITVNQLSLSYVVALSGIGRPQATIVFGSQ